MGAINTVECPKCGYDAGAGATCCPECGAGFDAATLTAEAALARHRALWMVILTLPAMFCVWRESVYAGGPAWMFNESQPESSRADVVWAAVGLAGFGAALVCLRDTASERGRRLAAIGAGMIVLHAVWWLGVAPEALFRYHVPQAARPALLVGLQLLACGAQLGASVVLVLLARSLADGGTAGVGTLCRAGRIFIIASAVFWMLALLQQLTRQERLGGAPAGSMSVLELWGDASTSELLRTLTVSSGLLSWTVLGGAALFRGLRSLPPGAR